MTVVLEYRSGRVEIVSFLYEGDYPLRVRLRRVVGVERNGDPRYEPQVFRHVRSLAHGKPVYVEQEAPQSADAA